jgi:hypothetical protein
LRTFAVQPFRRGFGEAVGQRLEHDGAVVVVLRREFRQLAFDAEAGGDGEGAGVIAGAGG